jgi:hypothetical protein
LSRAYHANRHARCCCRCCMAVQTFLHSSVGT